MYPQFHRIKQKPPHRTCSGFGYHNNITDPALNATYINVYTDQSASANGITILTTNKMQGAAAAENMKLNWGISWAVGAEGEYPSIILDNSFYDEWDGSFVYQKKLLLYFHSRCLASSSLRE